MFPPLPMPPESERALQLDYHRDADPSHVAWQTTGPYFAATEARLLGDIRCDAGERLLEIGCGEGANLHHLGRVEGLRVGVDFSLNKTIAASATGAQVACADATRLPFADGAFDVVLIRDLLHHVPARLAVLNEAYRVLRRGGRLHLIEPNARSPLVFLQAVTVRAERGLLQSTERRLKDELAAADFRDINLVAAQPFPIARVVLNPRFGAPALGGVSLVANALAVIDDLSARILPQAAWLYLCFSAVRP